MLEAFGVPASMAKLLRYFLVRPEARPHTRELQRSLGLGGGSLQNALKRMEALGALVRVEEDGRVRYRAVWSSSAWRASRALLEDPGETLELIEEALADVEGLDAAFVFGSRASGEQRADSDVDLLVLEAPSVEKEKMLRQLNEVALLLDREVTAVRYTPRSLAERLGDEDHPAFRFLRDVLTGPKRWVAGDPSTLEPLMLAAGFGPLELDSVFL